MDNILIGLDIMWKGMAGIFAVIVIIMIFVLLMTKVGRKPSDKGEE